MCRLYSPPEYLKYLSQLVTSVPSTSRSIKTSNKSWRLFVACECRDFVCRLREIASSVLMLQTMTDLGRSSRAYTCAAFCGRHCVSAVVLEVVLQVSSVCGRFLWVLGGWLRLWIVVTCCRVITCVIYQRADHEIRSVSLRNSNLSSVLEPDWLTASLLLFTCFASEL